MMPKEPEKPKNNSVINPETLKEIEGLMPKSIGQTFVQKIESERSAAKKSQTQDTPTPKKR